MQEDNNVLKIINDIVWYIPFKKLRNKIRQLLLIYFNSLNEINILKDNFNTVIDDIKNKKQSRAYNIISDMILYKDKPKIYYLQTPEHKNIGDHAIVYASQKLLQDVYKDKIILEYSYNDLLNIGDLIDKFITKDDIIFLPGGGNMGDMYLNEEFVRREILKKYSKNKIIIFPESITFMNDKELELSKKIYNAHNNFTIFTRDEKSYKFAKEHFYNNKVILIPDIVVYLQNRLDNLLITESKREGIILIFRNDKEKILDNNLINTIKNKFTNYDEYDTYLDIDVGKESREKYIYEALNKIHSHKLCITDRFHGLIFSYITNTPCIVFDSVDHKIKYGAKWFENVEWIYKPINNDFDKNDFDKIEKFINKYLSNENFNLESINFETEIKNIFIKNVVNEEIINE